MWEPRRVAIGSPSDMATVPRGWSVLAATGSGSVSEVSRPGPGSSASLPIMPVSSCGASSRRSYSPALRSMATSLRSADGLSVLAPGQTPGGGPPGVSGSPGSGGRGPGRVGHPVAPPPAPPQPPPARQGGGGPADPPVAGPDAPGADHVDQPGLVLEVQEGGAAGGRRALPGGHPPTPHH